MRIYTIGFLFFLATFNNFAQLNVKTFCEKNGNGYQLYINNNEYCPISIKVSLKLDNLKSSDGNQNIYVVPAGSNRYKLSTLAIIKKRKKFKVKVSTNYNYGNYHLIDYNKNFEYCLPFQKGESYMLTQGYDGRYTHQNKNQLDFQMPIGTKIVAVRGGIIIKAVDVYNIHCMTKNCEKFNNYIYIYHDDGTIAEYVHIKKGSAKVMVGDLINKGQIIADSGNVGRSTGPHLHFSVFLQKLEGQREYVETKFKLEHGIVDYLKEKETYVRN